MKQFTPFSWPVNQFSYCLPWNGDFKCKSWAYLVILLSFFTVETWGNEHDYFFDIEIDEYSNPDGNLSCKDTIVVVITDGDCSMVEIDMLLENSPIGSNENLIFDIELYALFKTCLDNFIFLIVALGFSNFLTYFRTASSPFFFTSSMIDFTVEETEEEV